MSLQKLSPKELLYQFSDRYIKQLVKCGQVSIMTPTIITTLTVIVSLYYIHCRL